MMTEREKVPCQWCSEPTPMLGTRERNNCWEIRHRIEQTPAWIVRRILDATALAEEHEIATAALSNQKG